MLCEKCREMPATVHITQKNRGGAGVALNAEADHHFCERCGLEFMQSSPDFKVAAFSKLTLRREPNPNPFPPEPQIDTSKRYDVYCIEPNREVVVYRNALFKGEATLLPHPGGRGVMYPGYIESEQANGQSMFLPRISIIRFCEPGTTLVGEVVAPNKPV